MSIAFAAAAAVVGVRHPSPRASAAGLEFKGTHYDLVDLFPGGSPPYIVVPWRSEILVKPLDVDGNNVYGSAGYAFYGTTTTWPNADELGGSANFSPTVEDPLFPNLVSLPDFVANTQVLATKIVSGYAYSLIDQPELVNGYRDYNWGDTLDPPVDPPHSQSPYAKLGILDGGDILGRPDPLSAPAARWGFEVGAGVPSRFRVGVMTDGLDGTIFAPDQVFLSQVVNNVPTTTLGTGTLTKNRFVDMHFFDVVGAQPGDHFVFSAKGQTDPGFSSAGIAGFTFDVPSTPTADFDGSGFVDGGDVLVWQRHLGLTETATNAEGDADEDMSVTGADLAIWKGQFGTPSTAALVAIPEPATAALAALAAASLVRRRRFGRSR